MSTKQLLFWFNRRKPKERYVRQITVLNEQAGERELELQAGFKSLFDRCEMIKRAYLALVEYSDGFSPRVALCLSCFMGVDEREMLDEISEVFESFRKAFDPEVYLDVIFLMDFQEREVINICRPFYAR
jgi:hypothetical protein